MNGWGEFFFTPNLELTEKQKIEGYLSENWEMQSCCLTPTNIQLHLGLGCASGTRKKAGSYQVSVTATNQWGSISDTFDIEVLPEDQEFRLLMRPRLGSTSSSYGPMFLILGGWMEISVYVWD